MWGVSFEKGGKIVSAALDGKVKVFNLATKGRDALKLEGHEGGVYAVVTSADGKKVVSGGLENKVHVLDAETGELKMTLDGHTGGVSSVAVSKDGSLVISGGDRTAWVC